MKSVNSHSEIGWKLINGNEISRENNFDLIRLFAALQVLLGHGINHLQILGRNLGCYIVFPRSDGVFCNKRFFNNPFIY